MSRKLHVLHVVGARPNFMKLAPVVHALATDGLIRQTLIHTGQHYDTALSDDFFRQLDIPEPSVNLGVGSGPHGRQTAEVLAGLEAVLASERPDVVLVYGDVNSTMAAALAAAKLGIRVAHVEAGLRSFDRTMPEEINRVVTDHVADLHFTPSRDANANLLREGISESSIHFVGNVMIDTLVRCLPRCDAQGLLTRLGIPDGGRYILVTLHRPSTVDEPETLRGIVDALMELSGERPVIFPVHPRTQAQLDGRDTGGGQLILTQPLGYFEFIGLQRRASLVITDSGGVQEETTFLGVPCLTIRDNTERPVTVEQGTNRVIGRDPQRLLVDARRVLAEARDFSQARPELWDGHAGDRIAAILRETLPL